MGKFAGRTIADEVSGRGLHDGRGAFSYRDKGSLAIIGNAKAVADLGRIRLGGFLAWMIWGAIHIAFLIGFRNRMQVMLSWFWSWLLNARDARLITGPARLQIQVPRPPEFVADPVRTEVLAGGAATLADAVPAPSTEGAPRS